MGDDTGTWKVGELARAAGVTVRTLHYYDAIGLLCPERTSGGHRVYREAEVARLYRICLLRRLALPLEQIARALDDPAWTLQSAMRRQVRELDRRSARTEHLRRRIIGMLGAPDVPGVDDPETASDELPTAEAVRARDLLDALAEMTSLDTTVQRRIAVLVYVDIATAYRDLVRVFGFGEGTLELDHAGTAVHAEVLAGDGVIWLHRESDRFALASPRTLGAATGLVAVMVDDVDAHHARTAAAGADVLFPPTDQPYGVREYSARGPEGELWSFMSPLD